MGAILGGGVPATEAALPRRRATLRHAAHAGRYLPRMPLLYAGIDEAGYGPLLGPLCVGCAAFALEAAAPPPCLWSLLKGAVCRAPGDKRKRIAVDDSKKLKGAKDGAAHPLRHLERGVTAFAATVAGAPDFQTDDALLSHLGAPALPGDGPWHGTPHALPVGNDAAALRIAAAMLRLALARAQVETVSLRVEAIAAGDFNAQAARVGNKATINFMAAMRHVEAIRLAAAARGAEAWIALDQQGGRHAYMDPLRTSFPDARIRVLEESEATARYRLEWAADRSRPAHAATVSFELGGEDRNLPIALASMAAKFARELHMRRLNAFFAQQLPTLAPTAGYVQDGRRWMAEVAPIAKRMGIPAEALVRCI